MTPERWKRTEELYHAALARPPGGRAAFLAEACPDDESLRRDVESLLVESDSNDRFLEEPALTMSGHPLTPFVATTMAGASLGGYHLQALLGAGDVTLTRAPTSAPPCSSLTVPIRSPVRPWANAMPGNRIAVNSNGQQCLRMTDRPARSTDI